MFCKHCGAALADNVAFCASCGAPMEKVVPAAPVSQPAPVVTNIVPEENRPLSPWGYFGLQLLFAIPVVGFIFLIVFSCNGSNINRRNFARSYWCSLIILAVIGFIAALFYLLGANLQA